MKSIILASTSTVHGSGPLEYILPALEDFFNGIDEVCFVPYARPGGISYDEYTGNVELAFGKINKSIVGAHTFEHPAEGISSAKAIFTGGGNTFVLIKTLYELGLIDVLRKKVEAGTAYLGTSAGSNICGMTVGTTNDMPIVYPPSFDGLGLVPFNINPHYLDPDPGSTHMGETRETRIREFHVFNSIPVIGLREGSYLHVRDKEMILNGPYSARLFRAGKPAFEIQPGDCSILLEPSAWNEI